MKVSMNHFTYKGIYDFCTVVNFSLIPTNRYTAHNFYATKNYNFLFSEGKYTCFIQVEKSLPSDIDLVNIFRINPFYMTSCCFYFKHLFSLKTLVGSLLLF